MSICPQCHRVLASDSPGGLCPACALGMARPLPSPSDAPTQLYGDSQDIHEDAPPEIASLFPQLSAMQFLGQGGMGTVYKAYQPSLDRYVAVKLLSPRFASDPTFAERFAREARTLARLTHQNIINVYDFGQIGSAYFLIMEYVDGVNLREAMKSGSLSPEQALAIVPQVCEALQFAHDEGIVHRDIKPENILLDRKGRVKIADFGLAKLVDGTSDAPWTLTGSRQILGTLNYMAPEQIERPATVDHRADIYSLGVVLYELLTGELPLGRFPMPSEKGTTPAELDQVVLKTLEKEPERRYQQASEVRTAVEMAWPNPWYARSLPAASVGPSIGERQPGSAPNRSPRVPFTVTEPHLNLTTTQGVLRIEGAQLEIDYSTKENIFKSIQLKGGQHVIPLKDVLSIELQKRLYKSTLVLKLDRPLSLSGIPARDAGRFQLAISPDDHVEAWRLMNAVRLATGQPLTTLESTGYREPKTGRAFALQAVRGPAIGLLTAAAINWSAAAVLVVLLVLGAKLFSWMPVDLTKASSERNAWLPPESAVVLVLITLCTIWGVAQLLTGWLLIRLKRLPACRAGAIISLIPFQLGFVIGIPAGIWALVALSQTNVAREFT